MSGRSNKKRSFASVLLGVCLSTAFLLFLLRSDIAIDYMKIGLKLCSGTVIPSLFPFMVVSSLIVSSGIGIRLCRIFTYPARLLFGVSGGGACAFILGAFCGFPIGARVVCEMYDNGSISKSEAERILTFCNNPGSAFVTSAVGVSLFGSLRAGIALYACVILSSVIVGVTLRPFHKSEPCENRSTAAAMQVCSVSCRSVGTLFTTAIRESALSMLTVSATVVFFSSLVGCIGASLSALGAPDAVIAVIFGVFEISSGVSALSALQSPLSLCLCAAALGWSGLSVHLQIMAVCAGRNFSLLPYFAAKALQGAVCAALFFVTTRLFPSVTESSAPVGLMDATRYRGAFFLYVIMLFGISASLSILILEFDKGRQNRGVKKR